MYIYKMYVKIHSNIFSRDFLYWIWAILNYKFKDIKVTKILLKLKDIKLEK